MQNENDDKRNDRNLNDPKHVSCYFGLRDNARLRYAYKVFADLKRISKYMPRTHMTQYKHYKTFKTK